MGVFSRNEKNKKSKILYNIAMTEGQRDYLADLAGRKGVQLDSTENVSASWASTKIEELKALPDANYPPVSSKQVSTISSDIDKTLQEMKQWTFQA